MPSYANRSAVLPPIEPQAELSEIGKRLVLTRKALDKTTTEMCAAMGSISGGSAYTNYEMGRRRISIEHALRLCMVYGLTLEWIYRGRRENLPEHIQAKLSELYVAGAAGTQLSRAK